MELIKKVSLSKQSVFLTWTVAAILLAALVCYGNNLFKFIILAVITASLVTAFLIYSPVYVASNQEGVLIRKRFGKKFIAMSEINEVSYFHPTPLLINQRVVGSGGFVGYWGWFSDPRIGIYFAYYGNSSDCFLIKLKNGKQYVIGCEDSSEMMKFISDNL